MRCSDANGTVSFNTVAPHVVIAAADAWNPARGVQTAPPSIDVTVTAAQVRKASSVYDEKAFRPLTLLSGSTVIIAASSDRMMAHDIPFPYRQDPDFFYLTGLNEPDALAIIAGEHADLTLLVRPRDPAREIWDGPRAGLEGATAVFGAARTGDVMTQARGEVADAVAMTVAKSGRLYIDPKRIPSHLQCEAILGDLPHGSRGAPAAVIEALRAIKSPAEVALMREAGQITAASFCDAIAVTQELRTEGELAAMLEYGFKKRGAERQPIHPGARTLTQTVMGG